jgi:hypothetical protein
MVSITSERYARIWHAAHRLSCVLLLTGAIVACGSHARKDGEQPEVGIEECESFVASYERCLGTLGPAALAKARAAQVRAQMNEQMSSGRVARPTLRNKCSENLSRLKATCHS